MPLPPSRRMSDTDSSSVHSCFLASPVTRPDPGAVRIELLQALNPSKGQEANGREFSPGWEGRASVSQPPRAAVAPASPLSSGTKVPALRQVLPSKRRHFLVAHCSHHCQPSQPTPCPSRWPGSQESGPGLGRKDDRTQRSQNRAGFQASQILC